MVVSVIAGILSFFARCASFNWHATQNSAFSIAFPGDVDCTLTGGIRRGASGHDICFVHPKGNEQFPFGGEGVLIELVQAPAEVVAALGR